jgi:signal transduction histidine kinase
MNNIRKLFSKMSETTRVLIVATAFLVIANALLGVVLVRQSNSALKGQIDARLLDMANTAADMIDGDAYEKITSRDVGNQDYNDIYNMLKTFQDNIDLEFIYCVRETEDHTFYFTIDPAQEDCSEYGEMVKLTEALVTASKGIAAVDKEPYEDAYGRFYSAYSPIFNSKNEVVGVIAVDFSSQYYDDQFRKNLITIIGGIFCSVLTGAIIIAIYSIKIKHREELGRVNAMANKMITAMASDYKSVYLVDLDMDEGICYRSHSEMEYGLKEGEKFIFSQRFRDYAFNYVDESYRKDFLDFVSPTSIRDKLERNELVAFRYLIRRDGKESYEMLRMAGVRRPEDRDDNIVHAIGIGFTDVDEQVREDLEQKQQLLEALSIAEEANQAKTVFLSNMSHEIRTPMNAILGLDSLALSEEDVPPAVKEYLSKIGSSAQHLLGIINDILDMSRIESGKMTLKNDRFSLKNLFELINTMIASQCDDRHLTYTSKMDDDIDEFYLGDDMKLKEILINILSNSVKYTEPGGTVDFTVKKIATYGNKATLLFTMKDTGIGMDKEFIPKIFDSFSQEDMTVVNKYGSTGLGMAITKNLVDMMNGKIEVESKKGVGSEFRVTLTFEVAKDQQSDKEPSEGAADAKDKAAADDIMLEGRRILVAEDMDINAQIITKILNNKKMEVDRAENGQVAVDKFTASETGYYDAILMDMRMPVMGGLEATSAIRALDREDAKKIPIIALTANAFDEDVERSLQTGLNAHLSKPLEPAAIFRTLKNLIGKNEGK